MVYGEKWVLMYLERELGADVKKEVGQLVGQVKGTPSRRPNQRADGQCIFALYIRQMDGKEPSGQPLKKVF